MTGAADLVANPEVAELYLGGAPSATPQATARSADSGSAR